MSVTARYQELTLILPRDTITETWIERAYQAANALYEATWDAAAPDASAQAIQGHDHTPIGGGGPINRACLYSACTLDVLAEVTFSAANESNELIAASATQDACIIHASPGLRPTALLTGWICYYARNSDKFRLEFGPTGTVYDVDLPISDSEKLNWFQFQMPVVDAGLWRQRNIYVRCGSYDATSTPAFSLYALTLDERPDVLSRKGTPETERPGATGVTVRVAFPTLEDDLVAADEWVDAYSLRCLYEFGNGLYEGIEEKLAPGASAQTCRGHDHDSSSYGGRAIARGGCYTASLQGTTYLYRIAWNGTSYSGYQAWDLDDGANRRSNNGVGMALFWVSPGLTSSGAAPSNPPYLTAYLYVEWDAGVATPTMNFRGVHLASTNASAVTTISSTASYSGWVKIDSIYCAGDAVNEIEWQVEMTGTSNTVNIDLYAFVVYEVPGIGARTNSSLPVLASGVD